MTVRSATLDDLAVLEELWRAFEAEVPPPAHEEVDLATELAEIRAIVESGARLGGGAGRRRRRDGRSPAAAARGWGGSPTSTSGPAARRRGSPRR